MNWWKAPELRVAIAEAHAGATHAAIAKHLGKLGYRRSAYAVEHRLRLSGILSKVPDKRWSIAECDALRAAYANGSDR